MSTGGFADQAQIGDMSSVEEGARSTSASRYRMTAASSAGIAACSGLWLQVVSSLE